MYAFSLHVFAPANAGVAKTPTVIIPLTISRSPDTRFMARLPFREITRLGGETQRSCPARAGHDLLPQLQREFNREQGSRVAASLFVPAACATTRPRQKGGRAKRAAV